MDVVNLERRVQQLSEFWAPQEVGRVNDTAIKVVKLLGEFPRHQHEEEDECFLVLEGELTIDLDDGSKRIGPGEFLVVPRATPHRPHCEEPVKLVLIELASTVQFGDAGAGAVTKARATAQGGGR